MVDINRTTLSAEFPMLADFNDYHDIGDHKRLLMKLFGRRIGSEEVGFCEQGQYWGIFYVGRKPNKAVIKQLLADANFKPMDDDEE